MDLFHHHKHHIHQRKSEEYTDLTFERSLLGTDELKALIARAPQSTDDYGAAPGEAAGGGGGGGGGGNGDNTSGGGGDSGNTGGSTPSSSGSSNPISTGAGDNPQTVAIALGVILPVLFIVITLFVVWRIVKKRNRIEKQNEKHASLDFGLGEVSSRDVAKRGKSKKAKKGDRPEMMDLNAEKDFRKARGISMDMRSPYVLASEVTEGRPSFNSFTRSHDGEDPYRPVNLIRSESPSATPSAFTSRPVSRKDSASVWTQSSDNTQHGIKSNLVSNAQKPSRNSPPELATGETPLLGPLSSLSPADPSATGFSLTRKPISPSPIKEESRSISDFQSPSELDGTGLGSRHQEQAETSPQQNEFNFNLPTFAFAEDSEIPSFTFTDAADNAPPPRSSSRPSHSSDSRHESLSQVDDYVTYADVLGIAQKEADAMDMPEDHGLGMHGFDVGPHRLSASIRPLPPDDPSDNPETRANRIRSFYKEYFDESRHDPQGDDRSVGVDYYEDYNQEYLDDATHFDHASGQFLVAGAPYAQPITRRAMTPPPRAPPRFGTNSQSSNGMHGPDAYGPGAYGPGAYGPGAYGPGAYGPGAYEPDAYAPSAYGHGAHRPGQRPRGYSSVSAQGYRGRAQRRNLPPPLPLSNLPTPHLLKGDSAIFNSIDFAPPSNIKDRAAGRPDSPHAVQRPYSPSTRPFTPLASSFDDLRVMPSPYALRKSGTFTGLDFAPPPRINTDTGSDAGSIHSGRSQMSASHVANIRAGAYAVSRMPKDFVGTKDDFATALRPTWDQRGTMPM